MPLPEGFNPALINPQQGGGQMPRPHVEFKTVAVYQASASVEAGQATFVDQDIVSLRAPGSKDSVDKVATEWLDQLVDQAKKGQIPITWPREYREAFEMYKSDKTLSVEGTPIQNWPVATPAQVQNCLKMGIKTVEQLAIGNEEMKIGLGMAATGLVTAAKNWVDEVKTKGVSVQKLTAAEITNGELKERIKLLEANNKELEGALALANKK